MPRINRLPRPDQTWYDKARGLELVIVDEEIEDYGRNHHFHVRYSDGLRGIIAADRFIPKPCHEADFLFLRGPTEYETRIEKLERTFKLAMERLPENVSKAGAEFLFRKFMMQAPQTDGCAGWPFDRRMADQLMGWLKDYENGKEVAIRNGR
jgi:hypothetical protein